jgi:hypothetical protein
VSTSAHTGDAEEVDEEAPVVSNSTGNAASGGNSRGRDCSSTPTVLDSSGVSPSPCEPETLGSERLDVEVVPSPSTSPPTFPEEALVSPSTLNMEQEEEVVEEEDFCVLCGTTVVGNGACRCDALLS